MRKILEFLAFRRNWGKWTKSLIFFREKIFPLYSKEAEQMKEETNMLELIEKIHSVWTYFE